jgi:catechol 2,3-dioxygenase-like lactoylglutathione lyase family enzyme
VIGYLSPARGNRQTMIRGIDHIVIAVRELETAIADYAGLGFTVVRGGRHSGLNTHNALIAFADGCYCELIAFLGPPSAAAHWWCEALQRSGGLTDFCVQSDSLEDDAAAFRRAGATISAPYAMGRERPDGYLINWELAVNEGGTRGLVPFFIRDLTPHDERVPRQRTHRNGATGVESLTIAVANINSIRLIYEKALGRTGEAIERDDLQAAGVRFALGPHELHLIAPRNSYSGVAAERLRVGGPSPLEVKLSGSASHGVLDTGRAHGARIVLG